MRVSEGQTLGALAFLMVFLTVYGILFLNDRFPVRVLPGPWGNQEPGTIAVEIAGDPASEGIYFLPEKTTLGKFRAMGIVPETGESDGVEDELISDGSVVEISGKGDVKIRKMTVARRLALGLPIDINRASEEDIVLVPGIGEETAHRIIQLRKQRGAFRELSELTALPGIKKKRLDRLRKYLNVGASRGRI